MITFISAALQRNVSSALKVTSPACRISRTMSTINTSDLPKSVPSFARNFPSSTASPSFYFRYPGTTAQSTQAVRTLLEENDRRYDIYEQQRFAHNHTAHSLLTRYALGAPPKLLVDTAVHDAKHSVALDPNEGDRKVVREHVPDRITRENWTDKRYLGQKDAYSAYLVFFHAEVERLGPIGALEEYIFSAHANYESNGDQPGGNMLDRLVAGVLHPFIQIGFGLEFRDRVVVAEGLAEAAIHSTETTISLLGDQWPKGHEVPNDSAHPAPLPKSNLDEWRVPYPSDRQPRAGKSLLEIYGIMQSSEAAKPVRYDQDLNINQRIIKSGEGERGKTIMKLAKEWSLTDEEVADGPDGWVRKLEEVAVLVTLLACGSGRTGKNAKVDFFLMHTLTSSIFLPAYLHPLSPPLRRILLRTYLLDVLLTAEARGRPQINLELLMSRSAHPVGPAPTPEPKDTISDPRVVEGRNGWMALVESSLYAQDSHVPKAIRSLMHYSSKYGSTPPGGFIGATTSDGKEAFPGSSQMDGSIFIRGAGIIMEVSGWCREGEEAGWWEMSPVGYDEVWE